MTLISITIPIRPIGSGYPQQEVVSLFCLDQVEQLVLHEGFEKFGVELVNSVYLANFEITPTLRMNQEVYKKSIKAWESLAFSEDKQCVLWFGGRICIPNQEGLKKWNLQAARDTPLFHPPREYQVIPGRKEFLVEWNGFS